MMGEAQERWLAEQLQAPKATWQVLAQQVLFSALDWRSFPFVQPSDSPARDLDAWDGATAKVACWVRHIEGDRFQVFAVNCAHLGCPVRWFAQSRLFMCPCHGGAYYEDGSRASGPPPRGLFEYEYQVRDGVLWVRGGQLPTLSRPV